MRAVMWGLLLAGCDGGSGYRLPDDAGTTTFDFDAGDCADATVLGVWQVTSGSHPIWDASEVFLDRYSFQSDCSFTLEGEAHSEPFEGHFRQYDDEVQVGIDLLIDLWAFVDERDPDRMDGYFGAWTLEVARTSR